MHPKEEHVGAVKDQDEGLGISAVLTVPRASMAKPIS